MRSGAPVDVWIGEDDVVRRIHVDDGTFDGTMEFFDFGVGVEVEPPPADQVEEGEEVEESVPSRPCDPERGTPIRGNQAREALQRAGLSLAHARTLCSLNAVALLESGDLVSPGGFQCEVFEKPSEDAPATVIRRTPGEGFGDLSLQNVQCIVIADDEQGAEVADKLEAALEGLERRLRR